MGRHSFASKRLTVVISTSNSSVLGGKSNQLKLAGMKIFETLKYTVIWGASSRAHHVYARGESCPLLDGSSNRHSSYYHIIGTCHLPLASNKLIANLHIVHVPCLRSAFVPLVLFENLLIKAAIHRLLLSAFLVHHRKVDTETEYSTYWSTGLHRIHCHSVHPCLDRGGDRMLDANVSVHNQLYCCKDPELPATCGIQFAGYDEARSFVCGSCSHF